MLAVASAGAACSGSGPSSDPTSPALPDSVRPGTTFVVDDEVAAQPPTLPPPEALDELVAGLLSTDAVGVPTDWFILDLDPALVDDPAFEGDLDPFRGLIECPPGAARSLDAPWLSRRFTVADTFLDNGVLSIEAIVHLDDAAGHAERLGLAQECTAAVEGTELQWSQSTVADDATPDAVGIPTDVLRVEGAPDDQTPFPYSIVATSLQRSGFSVTAIVGGEPPDDGWSAISERVAVDALLALEAG